MDGYWSETRLDGRPLEPGTVCWVTEVPGQNPIATYGKSVEEVLQKVTRTMSTAQAALVRKAAAPAATPGGGPVSVPARKRMTSDEVMTETANLSIPGKSGEAVVRFVEDATGIDLKQMMLREYRDRAEAWVSETPAFYDHPGNATLLTNEAARLTGGDIASISKDVLTQAFHNLRSQGVLFEAPAALPNTQPRPDNLTTFPGGSPVQRVEEQRGARFATGTRSTNFRGSQNPPPKTSKYTPDDIRRMSPGMQKRLIETNDPDYAAAVDAMVGTRATA